MHTEAFCRHLSAVIASTEEKGRIELLAKELALFFDVEPHEVGLFKIDSAGRLARFVWPETRLRHNIEIPLKLFGTSLVSSTANKLKASINNTFASTTHLHMFENALVEREHCLPLQKVITAPCVDQDKLVWIIQISRKGKTLAEAGPDFTLEQLNALEIIANKLVALPL